MKKTEMWQICMRCVLRDESINADAKIEIMKLLIKQQECSEWEEREK